MIDAIAVHHGSQLQVSGGKVKIKPAILAKKSLAIARMPVNAGKTAVNLAVQFWPLVWMYLRGAARMPGRAWVYRKELRRIGLYQFTDRKGRKFNIVLLDGVVEAAHETIGSPQRQYILDTLRAAVAVDAFCPDFEVPAEVALWNHPVRGARFERLHDASRAERKSYYGSPVREISSDYLTYMRGF